MGSYVCFEDVGKIYTTGEVETQALHQVNLTIEKGESSANLPGAGNAASFAAAGP